MTDRILILEDDVNISSIIKFNLEANGWTAVCEFDGGRGIERLKTESYDLLILDIMLPTKDGFEVLKELRAFSDIPVIILSARTDESDKLQGLTLMADDYMTKPFSVTELTARVKVNLSRYKGTISDSNSITVGDTVIDTEKYTLKKGDTDISVSKKEIDILLLLVSNRGKVVTREEILEKVWGYSGYLGNLHTVDVAIGRLRAKIEDTPSEPKIILSRRGVGYYVI